MKYMRHSVSALLFVASTVAQAAPDNARAVTSPTPSKPASTSSAHPQPADTGKMSNTANTAVQTYPTYNYQLPVQPSTGPTAQAVQATSSSSSRYKFTEVAPRSLW
jgi:hypothetical protein